MPTPAILCRLPRLLLGFALALAVPAGAEDHAALGREALARADYRGAAEHLEAASRELEGGDREKLSEVQMDLGVAYLTGLSRPDDALRAFVRAADLAAHPASAWLWASTAAEALGQDQEAARYRALALGRKAAAEAPAAEPAVEPVPAPIPAPVPAPVPVIEPAPEVEPTPVPEPEPAPEPEKPSAFGHFFGAKGGAEEKASEPPAEGKGAAEGKKGSADDREPPRDETPKPKEKKPETEAPAKPAGSAFDHFFKRKPADEAKEPAANQPPPR